MDGEFNGTKVNIIIGTNNNKVWRIGVLDVNPTNETNIKIRFKINDDKGNISKTDPFSYEFNGSSKKVKDNDTFSIDQTFKNDTLHIMRCIDLTNITNNTTTCSIDPLPECIIINKIPIFNLIRLILFSLGVRLMIHSKILSK